MATAENPTVRTARQQSNEADAVFGRSPVPDRWRFNVDEYYRMADAGIFRKNPRVELIEGDVVNMGPIGSPHHGCVTCLNTMLTIPLVARAIVSVRGPLRLNDRSEPEPDVLVLKPRPDFYRSAHPGPSDVLLLIEVTDGSAGYDRNVKLGLYAGSRVPEVWLVDLNAERVEVYRRPEGAVYSEKTEAARGQSLSPAVFPDVVLGVDAILG